MRVFATSGPLVVEEGVGVIGSVVKARGGYFAYYKGKARRDPATGRRHTFASQQAARDWIIAQADNEEN